MEVTKIEEFAKTGFETQWCLTTTGHEEMLMRSRGSIRYRIGLLANKVADGFEKLLYEHYKKEIEAEERAATEAFESLKHKD